MQKPKIAFFVVLVAGLVLASVSGFYLLKRYPVSNNTGPGGTTNVSAADDRTKAGDRNDRPANKPKRQSSDGKLKATFPSDLNPEQARKLLAEFIAKNTDIEEQTHYAAILVEKLCDNGYSEAAWDFISPENLRSKDTLYWCYFSYADLPSDQLLTKLEGLTKLGHVVSGFRGYMYRFSPTEMGGIVSSERARDILKKARPRNWQVLMNQAVRDTLTMNLSGSVNADFAIISAAAEMNAKGQLGSLEFLEIVSADKTTTAFDKWGRMLAINPASIQEKDEKDQLMKERGRFISAMLIENAPETLSLMLKSESEYKDRDLASSLGRWVDIHSSEPSDWVVKNRDKMSVRQQSIAADTLAGKALNAGEFEGARLWAKEIPDEARRAKTLAAIDAKEAAKQKPRAGN